MTYEQSLEYLASLNRFGINLGLARIEKLLELMQHPELRYKTIHVTGTNGKGSTTAMIASMLSAAGIRTGMYTSPHLVDYTERMLINGEPITRSGFAQAIDYTRQFVTVMTADGSEHPTEFEVITAAAFYYFAASGVEYAVIEVGLGGLLDSTNVIIPEVSIITNVSIEHTDRCGDTIEAIAAHKAGIIKQGKPVITGAAGKALEVIERTADEKRSPVYRLGTEFSCCRMGNQLSGQTICWRQEDQKELGPFTLRLLGRHQLDNAALAIMAIRVLACQDSRITTLVLSQGLETVQWPGRFEWIAGTPGVIIDGAHNPAGAETLRQALDEYFPDKSITFVLGILKDKDREGIIKALLRPEDIVITVAPVSERASDAGELLALIGEISKAEAATAAVTLEDGIEQAMKRAGATGVLCIAGSLYLVGPAREIVYNR